MAMEPSYKRASSLVIHVAVQSGTHEAIVDGPVTAPPTPVTEANAAAGAGAEVKAVAEAEAPQQSTERPSTLLVGESADGRVSSAGSAAARRDSQLTNRGFFDVKFYHNKLW